MANSTETMDLQASIQEMRIYLDSASKEVAALTGGKKSASTSSRKSMQKIIDGAKSLRKNIITTKKSLPTVKRVLKTKVPVVVPDPVSEVEEMPAPPVLKRAVRKKKK